MPDAEKVGDQGGPSAPKFEVAASKTPEEVLADLKGLSHKQRAKVLSTFHRKDTPQELRISQFVSADMWQGPLPSPESLERFNKVVPGLAERLVKLTENQQAHRIEMESHVSREQLRQSGRGQYFALLSTLVIVGVGAFALYLGFPATGATIITSTVIGTAYVFITGKKQEQQSRLRKREEIEESERAQAEQRLEPKVQIDEARDI